MQLGFIGLGNMGSLVAHRLLAAGYPLGVHSRHPDSIQALVDLGAQIYTSPLELARKSDVVLTMLPDDAALEHVLLDADGVLSGVHAGATIIDLSSVHPSTSRSIATAAGQRHVSALDAPVSGSTPQAEAGTLLVFVGGERDVYDSCRPIFEAISNSRFFMGPSGAGATMKLVVNDLLGVGMQAVAEALVVNAKLAVTIGTLPVCGVVLLPQQLQRHRFAFEFLVQIGEVRLRVLLPWRGLSEQQPLQGRLIQISRQRPAQARSLSTM